MSSIKKLYRWIMDITHSMGVVFIFIVGLGAGCVGSMSVSLIFTPVAWADDAPKDTAVNTNASIIMYHRFGDARYPSTNTTLEQLKMHLKVLQEGPYKVLPLSTIISHQARGLALPPYAVGIAVDDAYASLYNNGWPILRETGFPFTIFIATESVERDSGGFMTWSQLRELVDTGVEIGSQTHTHPHMPVLDRATMDDEIRQSVDLIRENIGIAPRLFAYPYGEMSPAAIEAVRAAGFEAAFGQHSGAFNAHAPRYSLPRFSMNERHGDKRRLLYALNALAMTVDNITPMSSVITTDNPPAMGFTLHGGVPRGKDVACFLSHAKERPTLSLLSERIEIRTPTPFPVGRTRLNCTARAGGADAGRWYWFGRQFFRAR